MGRNPHVPIGSNTVWGLMTSAHRPTNQLGLGAAWSPLKNHGRAEIVWYAEYVARM